jgi:hypothetical protein
MPELRRTPCAPHPSTTTTTRRVWTRPSAPPAIDRAIDGAIAIGSAIRIEIEIGNENATSISTPSSAHDHDDPTDSTCDERSPQRLHAPSPTPHPTWTTMAHPPLAPVGLMMYPSRCLLHVHSSLRSGRTMRCAAAQRGRPPMVGDFRIRRVVVDHLIRRVRSGQHSRRR